MGCACSPRVLVASVGQRLVAYALLGSAPPGRLRRLRNTACSRTVTCLTASSSCPGTFAASDAEHGTWIYRFDIRTGFEVCSATAGIEAVTCSCRLTSWPVTSTMKAQYKQEATKLPLWRSLHRQDRSSFLGCTGMC